MIVLEVVVHERPYPASRPRSRRFKAKDGREGTQTYNDSKYEVARNRLRRHLEDAMEGRPPIDRAIPLWVEATCYLPVPASTRKRDWGAILPTKKPDRDNLDKTLLDAGLHVVWTDDSQVVDGAIRKRYAWDGQPRWDITVRTMEISQ